MIHDPTLDQFAEEQRRFQEGPPTAPRPPEITAGVNVRDVIIPGDLRLHVLSPKAPRALMLHAHAGGFVFGAPEMADTENSRLASELGIAVASVDYRLAPQYPHPAAIDDCEHAALWLLEDGERELGAPLTLVGGESAGANLAARTLLRLKARGAHTGFRGANFVVGMFDISMTPSQRLAPAHYFLPPTRLRELQGIVFPGNDEAGLRDPDISPLYGDFSGLPPAIFTIGTQDSLLDDTLFMAERWRAAGNETRLEVYPEGTHTFMFLPTQMAAEAKRRITAFIKACLD